MENKKKQNSAREFFKGPGRVVMSVFMVILFTLTILLIGLAGYHRDDIRNFFGGVPVDFGDPSMRAALGRSSDIAEEIAREGILLLRNEMVEGRPTLPLSEAEVASGNINVFGWRGSGYRGFITRDHLGRPTGDKMAHHEGGFILSGSGSGQATGSETYMLLDALEIGGFNFNVELMEIARNYRSSVPTAGGWRNLLSAPPHRFFRIWEPSTAVYTDEVMERAVAHSNIAMVVIGRLGGEGQDLPTQQFVSLNGAAGDAVGVDYRIDDTPKADGTLRHYLELSAEEEDLLRRVAGAGFERTILILNTCNHFELDFIENPEFSIDAVLSVGALGNRGTLAIPDILRGYREARVPLRNEDGVMIIDEETKEVLFERDEAGNYVLERINFSPSGRTVNTWPRRMRYDPVFLNSGQNYILNHDGVEPPDRIISHIGHKGATQHSPTAGNAGSNYIDYEEGIFLGYRYFETRGYEEARAGNPDWFSDHVQFPFGFGLSYTEFEWEVESITVSGAPFTSSTIITTTSEFEMIVRVTNTGQWYGRDVVQVYISPPFNREGYSPLQKSHVVLVDFAKTHILAPGESIPVRLNFSAYDFASYDALGQALGSNGFDGFVLEQGLYEIRLQTNSNQLARNAAGVIQRGVTEFNIPSTLNFDAPITVVDELTTSEGQTQVTRVLQPARNQFTGENAEAGVPIDGRAGRRTAGINGGAGINQLNRLDFEGTFPNPTFSLVGSQMLRDNRRAVHHDTSIIFGWFDDEEWGLDWRDGIFRDHPEHALLLPGAQDGGLSMSDPATLMRLGRNFDDPMWHDLLDQMTQQDLYDLIQGGGYKTSTVMNVGKHWRWNLDGPSGLNYGNQSIAQSEWTAFPVSSVLGQTWSRRLAYFMGLVVGYEARLSNVGAWYAPGVNLHRGPFAGRNFEYFGEDPFHSGIMGAEVSLGVLQNGVYVYVKHFVANDSETHRGHLRTWLSEQSLRELYLRPFELTVRRGRASGIMSGFNGIGALWTGGSIALNTHILRGEWGFRGSVVTDYCGYSGLNHMSASQGLRAGNDLWLTGVGGGGNEDAFGIPQQGGAPLWVHAMDRVSGSGYVTNHNVSNNFFSESGRIIFRRAAHNILFSVANAYWYANTQQPNEELHGVDVWNFISDERDRIIQGEFAFPWFWFWGVLPISLVFLGGAATLAYFSIGKFVLKKKREAKQAANDDLQITSDGIENDNAEYTEETSEE